MHKRPATLANSFTSALAAALAFTYPLYAAAADVAASATPHCAGTPLAYPVAQKVAQADDYHGTVIADPYRWLEDANSDATHAWVEAENKLTQSVLAQIPQRAAIRQRLSQLWNYERYSVPFKEGGRYFYSRDDGLQNQAALYTMDALDAAPRLLLDPNTLAADGTVALAGAAVSADRWGFLSNALQMDVQAAPGTGANVAGASE